MTADGTDASGKASIAISGNANRSYITTTQVEAPGGEVEINYNYHGSAGTSQAPSVSAPIDNLPPVAAAFTGRGREEEEIVSALAGKGGSAAISALKGIGGVGKTALAVKIGYRLTIYFPDAQLLIDLLLSFSAAISPSVAFSPATNPLARLRPKSRSAVSISPATKSSGTPSIAAS
jgi:hypothetical protein